MRLRAVVLTLLLAFIAEHAPWRLAVLYARTLVTSRGYPRTSDSQSRYWDAHTLEARLVGMGWQVTYEPDLLERGVYGYTNLDDRTIHIERSLSWNTRLAVLAHEGAHTLEPGRLSRAQAEVFAECVAALVARDGYAEHARYLATLKADFVTEALVDWQAIYRAAAILSD